MPHSFIFKPSGFLLSCQLPADWQISVDGDSFNMRIVAPGGSVVLNEKYYAASGVFFFHDISSLLESHMRSRGIQYADFTVQLLADNSVVDSATLHVIYCDRFTPCSDSGTFLDENFLSSLDRRRVAPDSSVSLFFFTAPGDSTSASVSYRWESADGQIRSGSFSILGAVASSPGIQQLNVSTAQIFEHAATAFSASAEHFSLLLFSVSVADRSATFFIDRTLRHKDSFIFRNCFNAFDFFQLPATTSVKTEVDRSLAVLSQSSLFYDQSVTQKFELETGPLTSDEAFALDQLMTSREVFRFLPNPSDDSNPFVLQEILITDISCDVSDSDDQPNSVKFSWRFADNRPLVNLPVPSGIFSSQFNSQFS